MNWIVYHQWYNLDVEPATALWQDKICVVNSKELAIELQNRLLSELIYARENDLIIKTSNYDSRHEDILIKEEQNETVFTSLDDILKHPDINLPYKLNSNAT